MTSPARVTRPAQPEHRPQTKHGVVEDVLGLLVGTVLASFGLFLLHSSSTVTGGTAGLALLLSYALPVPFGAIFVAVCLFFFAFSTVLSWNLFGKINVIYLFGRENAKRSTAVYTVIALVFIFAGTMMSNDLVWELTDLFNNLMVLPNALALFALTGTVAAIARNKTKAHL